MPPVSFDAVTIAYGHLPLLDKVALRVETRERIAIIGRNGSGKSTLLKLSTLRLRTDGRKKSNSKPDCEALGIAHAVTIESARDSSGHTPRFSPRGRLAGWDRRSATESPVE
jgi:ATPase subunit of ABC transporter with duplicated ATPase domains